MSESDGENALARIMYEEMERLAPGSEEYVEWDKIEEWERELFRLSIARVLSERELVLSCINNRQQIGT